LPLASTSARASINGPGHTGAALRAIDQVAAKRSVFELEGPFRGIVLDGAIVLHLVTVEVFLGRIAAVAIHGKADGIGKCARALECGRVVGCATLQQWLAGIAARPDLHHESALCVRASQFGRISCTSSIRISRVTSAVGAVNLLQENRTVKVSVEAIVLAILSAIIQPKGLSRRIRQEIGRGCSSVAIQHRGRDHRRNIRRVVWIAPPREAGGAGRCV